MKKRLADAPAARRIVTVRRAACRVGGVFSGAIRRVFDNVFDNVFDAAMDGGTGCAMHGVRGSHARRGASAAGFGFARAVAFAALIGVSVGQAAHAATTPPAVPDAARPTIIVLGDSLSAEYGLKRNTGWVELMRQRLASERLDYGVANASISGDTTSGGRARMPVLMERLKPAIVIVELGANDALRGVPLSTTIDNLRTIIEQAQQGHAKVMLIGMYVPPNYGPDYTQKFHAMYVQLSQQYKVPLVPFLLAGIENKRELFQADQIHPNEQAQSALLDNVWPTLKPMLATSGQTR